MAKDKHINNNPRDLFININAECHDLNALVRSAHARLRQSNNYEKDLVMQDAVRALRMLEKRINTLADVTDGASLGGYAEAIDSLLGPDADETEERLALHSET